MKIAMDTPLSGNNIYQSYPDINKVTREGPKKKYWVPTIKTLKDLKRRVGASSLEVSGKFNFKSTTPNLLRETKSMDLSTNDDLIPLEIAAKTPAPIMSSESIDLDLRTLLEQQPGTITIMQPDVLRFSLNTADPSDVLKCANLNNPGELAYCVTTLAGTGAKVAGKVSQQIDEIVPTSELMGAIPVDMFGPMPMPISVLAGFALTGGGIIQALHTRNKYRGDSDNPAERKIERRSRNQDLKGPFRNIVRGGAYVAGGPVGPIVSGGIGMEEHGHLHHHENKFKFRQTIIKEHPIPVSTRPEVQKSMQILQEVQLHKLHHQIQHDKIGFTIYASTFTGGILIATGTVIAGATGVAAGTIVTGGLGLLFLLPGAGYAVYRGIASYKEYKEHKKLAKELGECYLGMHAIHNRAENLFSEKQKAESKLKNIVEQLEKSGEPEKKVLQNQANQLKQDIDLYSRGIETLVVQLEGLAEYEKELGIQWIKSHPKEVAERLLEQLFPSDKSDSAVEHAEQLKNLLRANSLKPDEFDVTYGLLQKLYSSSNKKHQKKAIKIMTHWVEIAE